MFDDGEGREDDGEEDTEEGHRGLFFQLFQRAAELVGTGGGLAAAADAVEFLDDANGSPGFPELLGNPMMMDVLTCISTRCIIQAFMLR